MQRDVQKWQEQVESNMMRKHRLINESSLATDPAFVDSTMLG